VHGRWIKAPGFSLFERLRQVFDPLPVVAEDLGVITPEVEALRDQFELPGMKILQFAFAGGPANPYLPFHHPERSVVYTGTHDNDTTLGWYAGLSHGERQYVDDYLGHSREPMPWPLIRCALGSSSRLAIVPMQDLLGLGREHRMNMPGTNEGNWGWRFEWSEVPSDLAQRVRHLLGVYGRLAHGW
jgi:4-alpha-glucanotransferase